MPKESWRDRMVESTASELVDDLLDEMYNVWELDEDEMHAAVRDVLLRALEKVNEEVQRG